MNFRFLTAFPAMFDSYFGESVLKRACEKGLASFEAIDLRQFATDKHRKLDDTPYGGGAGMVMKAEPIFHALEAMKIKNEKLKMKNEGADCGSNDTTNIRNSPFDIPHSRIILLSAKGKTFTQEDARRLVGYDEIVFICGRYEGVDERVAEHLVDEEVSIGNYVLTGGELPAMVVADAVARLIPGVLGNETSAETESHSEPGYLEYPQYTKPETFNGWKVPDVLLSGNHAEIEKWRREQSTDNRQQGAGNSQQRTDN